MKASSVYDKSFKSNLPSPYQSNIQKLSEGKYFGKKDDLFLVFERITPENIQFWDDYIENQDRLTKARHNLPHDTGIPVNSFGVALDYWCSVEVWIAYATSKDITQSNVALNRENDIEMTFTVMTDKKIPFTTHMGIFRAAEFYQKGLPIHKNLSMELHSFAAKAEQLIYPNKDYMITKLMDAMRDIMIKYLPPEALFIGNAQERNEISAQKLLIEKYEIDPDNINIYEYIQTIYVAGIDEYLAALDDIEIEIGFIDDYKSYADFIDAKKRYFNQVQEVFSKLESLSDLIKNGKIAENCQRSAILVIIKEGICFYENQIKDKIEQHFEITKQKILKDYYLFFGKGNLLEETSPIFIQGEEEFTIIKPSGEEIKFRKPEFYNHEHLNVDFPTVIIKLEELSHIRSLDIHHLYQIIEETSNQQDYVLLFDDTTEQSKNFSVEDLDILGANISNIIL